MANLRRTLSLPSPTPPLSPSSSSSGGAVGFLKRPSALPFFLSLLLVLTWLFLRFDHPSTSRMRSSLYIVSRSTFTDVGSDLDANLVRFRAGEYPTAVRKDRRGWLINPVAIVLQARVSGGAIECTSVHVGQIQPGSSRGNHRHHTCNETFVIWGARTKFRLENPNVKDKGYGEVTIGSDEVAVAASPSGTAHALINVDNRPTYFLGCQDSIITNSSTSDYKVWKDL